MRPNFLFTETLITHAKKKPSWSLLLDDIALDIISHPYPLAKTDKSISYIQLLKWILYTVKISNIHIHFRIYPNILFENWIYIHTIYPPFGYISRIYIQWIYILPRLAIYVSTALHLTFDFITFWLIPYRNVEMIIH